MTEVSALDIAFFIGVLLSSSILGVLVSACLPWKTSIPQKGVIAFGLTLAPFICGILSISVLLILPGASQATHVATIFGAIFILGATLAISRRAKIRPPATLKKSFQLDTLFIAFFFISILLIYDSLTLPLTQNDALEYATVGREIFFKRTLHFYPLLDTTQSVSGFYAPWTHPPFYVAQIYFTQVLQGHADFPGLMRLLAPWMLIVTSALLSSLVTGKSDKGRLTGLLFITTPLIYLGANSSLIDMLPISGACLVFASILYLRDSLAKWIVVGILMGITLWTHSQALLLVPIFLGVISLEKILQRKWIEAAYAPAVVLTVSLLVGFYPYLKNFRLFGSFISDSPPVVSLKFLHWDEYFFLARGIDTFTSQIQYGLLKGWSNLASYGVLFWLAAAGTVFFILSFKNKKNPASAYSDESAPSLLSGIILITYHTGVILSILLGLNIMIKNDRYLLLISPFAAVLGGYALFLVSNSLKNRLPLPRLINPIIAAGFCLQGWLYHIYRERSFPAGEKTEYTERLKSRPEYNLIFTAKDSMPKNAIVYTTKPADLYYSDRRMITHTDPSLISFYNSKTAEEGYSALLNLGITHIHQPDFLLPTVIYSPLLQIMANPKMSTLQESFSGHQVYKLEPAARLMAFESVSFMPASSSWKQDTGIDFGGSKSFAYLKLDDAIFSGENVETRSLFQKELKTTISSPILHLTDRQRMSKEIRISLTLRGQAYVKLWLTKISGNKEDRILLGDLTLADTDLQFQRRETIASDAQAIIVSIDQMGASTLSIEKITIDFYEEN
ncbi:hypothetical protein AZI85_16010 [Bdellovibrio bacteriovorus]|uniref:Glycosyltransferase RgtA/B/C/D-like domain-containing protein n=1 Tax=Bdellovibrio bacteriovorus TaxID=959 RepID=A0A150WTQ2_BDEBC|nr:hypothetical protein [Bdellovibrio bacteriovorus]KYG69897.1 hypothetical protein AZI85_16010 [Bdellovibrio bacteriovorus]